MAPPRPDAGPLTEIRVLVGLEDPLDLAGFPGNDHHGFVLNLVAKRRYATAPEALSLGGRDLAPDPL